MKYETPELKIINFDVTDIIQTSGIVPPGQNDTPFLPNIPKTTELDDSFDNN